MDYRLKDKLELNGIDVEAGISRYLSSETAYFKALKEFFDSNEFLDFIHMINLNLSLALNKSNNLPNYAKNLGLIEFSNLITELRNKIRINDVDEKSLDNIILKYNELKEIVDLI